VRRAALSVVASGTMLLALAVVAPAAGAATGTVTAQDQAYTTAEGTALPEPSASLEIGSTDTDPNPAAQCCTAALASAPADGTVTVNPDGSFVYTPDAGFSGKDTFTYALTDTDANVSAPAAVTITVLANCDVNAWPVTGSPAVAPQSPKGFYLGQKGGTFTLLTAHKGDDDVVFSGSVTIAPAINGIRLSNVIPTKLDDSGRNVDKVTIVGEQRLQFRFNTFKSVDGVSFHPSCNVSISFRLVINGVMARRRQIFLGSPGAYPASNPFTLSR